MSDITSDFACLKVSALGKASRISGEIDQITIGPDSVTCFDESKKLENIENEQNCCNIKSLEKIVSPQNKKFSTQNGITFSMKKILVEEEYQRKEKVQKKVWRRVQSMQENGRVIQERMELLRSNMAYERERRSAEKLANIMAEEERIAEEEKLKKKYEQQVDAQKAEEQKTRIEQEIQEYNRKMNEMEYMIKNVDAKITFGEICSSSTKITKVKEPVILGQIPIPITELGLQIDNIVAETKVGDLNPAVQNITQSVIQQMPEVESILSSETVNANIPHKADDPLNINKIKVSEQQPKIEIFNQDSNMHADVVYIEKLGVDNVVQGTDSKSNNLNVQTEDETVKDIVQENPTIISAPEEKLESNTPVESKQEPLYKYVDEESLQIYVKSQQFLKDYTENYKEFLQSVSTKKFRFECQKAINLPVNAISGINEQHLRDKYIRLHDLLIGNSSLNMKHHPHAAVFCKDILAKKIVNQGETLVSSKPKMAFPIAAITVALWNDHSDFGELLLAHFHEVCPFTVPVFMPRKEGQSNEEYYKSLGYKYDDGNVEKQDKYLKRMSGVMRLYASITVTPLKRGVAKLHPHGLQNAWRWLAATLNSEPQPDISDLSSTLILDILEVTGHALLNAYPTQFKKLLLLLTNEYYPRMQNSAGIGGGPLVRLEEFLKNVLKNGSIAPPDGFLPPNFW